MALLKALAMYIHNEIISFGSNALISKFTIQPIEGLTDELRSAIMYEPYAYYKLVDVVVLDERNHI